MANIEYQFGDYTAERIVLAAGTQSNKMLDKIIRDCEPDDFCDPVNRVAFIRLQVRREQGRPTDEYSVWKDMEATGQTCNRSSCEIFGIGVIGKTELANAVKRLKEKSLARRIIRGCETAIGLVKEDTAPADIIDGLRNMMADITTAAGYERERLTPEELADAVIDTALKYQDPDWRKENLVMTGIPAIDNEIQGFEAGDMIIISGATGTGKSAHAIDTGYSIGAVNHVPTLYINSEMSQNQVNLRLASRAANVSNSALRGGKATKEDIAAIKNKQEEIKDGALYTAKCSDLSFDNIMEELDLALSYNVKFVIIDYFGRTDFAAQKNMAEWQLLMFASSRLKEYALLHHIIIVLMCQTNVDGQLAGSKGIARDADFWFDLKKLTEEEQVKMNTKPFNYLLDIKKARSVAGDGQIGMYFDADRMTFVYDEVDAANCRKAIEAKKNAVE